MNYWNYNYKYEANKINEPIIFNNFITGFECQELLRILTQDKNLRSNIKYDPNGNQIRKCNELYMICSLNMSYRWLR